MLYYIILYYIILYYIIKAYSCFYGLNVLLTKLVTAIDCNTTLLPNET